MYGRRFEINFGKFNYEKYSWKMKQKNAMNANCVVRWMAALKMQAQYALSYWNYLFSSIPLSAPSVHTTVHPPSPQTSTLIDSIFLTVRAYIDIYRTCTIAAAAAVADADAIVVATVVAVTARYFV